MATCNTSSRFVAVTTATALILKTYKTALEFRTSYLEGHLLDSPHSVVDSVEKTDSAWMNFHYEGSNKISIVNFSANLFEGICSYTDQELEAHSRVLNNLSVDSGVNILTYL